jgi:hypothetical protein
VSAPVLLTDDVGSETTRRTLGAIAIPRKWPPPACNRDKHSHIGKLLAGHSTTKHAMTHVQEGANHNAHDYVVHVVVDLSPRKRASMQGIHSTERPSNAESCQQNSRRACSRCWCGPRGAHARGERRCAPATWRPEGRCSRKSWRTLRSSGALSRMAFPLRSLALPPPSTAAPGTATARAKALRASKPPLA